MIKSFILQTDLYKQYVESFNDYALSILYGGNIVIGQDIEDEWKDVPIDDEE